MQKRISIAAPIPPSHFNSPTPMQCGACHARHIGLCDALSNEDLRVLAGVAQRIVVLAGKTLIEEGDTATHYYDLSHGNIRIFKSLADGRRQITGFMGTGHFLGLAVSGNYAFSAEAITDTQLCRFDRAALLKVFTRFPVLERTLLNVATHEMVNAHEQMLLLGRKTALERVVSFLTSWADQNGSRQNTQHENMIIELPMNRVDLADYLGLTTETVSRSFSQLKRDGVIDFEDPRSVTLLRAHQARKPSHFDSTHHALRV